MDSYADHIYQDPGYRYANTYVLKTYRFKDAKDKYDTEVKAFRALRAGGSVGKCIIGFYGSYEQDGSYNILLEYADRGTLEHYLWRTPSPTTGDDIYKFWGAFFNVIKALKLIHNVQGGNPDDPPVLQGHVFPF
jgi:serine/threonine protein kinase